MKIRVESPLFRPFMIDATADGRGRCDLPKVAFTHNGTSYSCEVMPSGSLATNRTLRRALGFQGLTEEAAYVIR